MIAAKILADSKNPLGTRLITFLLVYPRFIHAEIMTHRTCSRNAASSRAIPVKKLMQRVMKNPATPVFWGSNEPGMQANSEMTGWKRTLGVWIWMNSRYLMLVAAWLLSKLGMHKQLVNRLIESHMNIEVILTCDQFGLANLLYQRLHKDAQPEFRVLAKAIWEAMQASKPVQLKAGELHLPLIFDEDRKEVSEMVIASGGGKIFSDITQENAILKAVSVGRCARVSYLNHEGKRALKDDIALHDRLKSTTGSSNPGHYSPFEHVATALATTERIGNFTGFRQYRKDFGNENITVMPNFDDVSNL